AERNAVGCKQRCQLRRRLWRSDGIAIDQIVQIVPVEMQSEPVAASLIPSAGRKTFARFRTQIRIADHLIKARRVCEPVIKLSQVRRAKTLSVRAAQDPVIAQAIHQPYLRNQAIPVTRVILQAAAECEREIAERLQSILEPRVVGRNLLAGVI